MTIITSRFKNFVVVLVTFFGFYLFFTNVENSTSTIKSSLFFCFNSLIPSMFIFMVISSFLLYSSAFQNILDILPNKFFTILGICKKHFPSILLSFFCGFVNGPRSLCEDFSKKGGDKTEFSNAIILSSNVGLGFLIGCIGGKIWGNISYGFFLFFVQMISSFLLGKILLKHPKSNITVYDINHSSNSLSSAFSKAVTTSASTMISICAFVIVFTSFINVFCSWLNIGEDSHIISIIKIFFEFCMGSFYAISFENTYLSAFLTGFCIGFGGLCVHFQTFAVCDGFPLDKIRFVLFKLFHGILCGAFSFLYVFIIKIEPIKQTALFTENKLRFPFLTVFLIACIIFMLIKRLFNTFLKNNIDFLEK